MTVTLHVATSLDGYIARKDHSLDWVDPGLEQDRGLAAFGDSVDGLLMGSGTYEAMRARPPWPFEGRTAFIFTRREMWSDVPGVEFVTDDVPAAIARLHARGMQRLWLVGGGRLLATFLRHDLIDEVILSIVPVALGDGIPLFPAGFPERRFDLVDVRAFPSGLAQLHHRRRSSPPR